MLTLRLSGEDVGANSYWAWEWQHEGKPGFVALDRADVTAVIDALDAALPGTTGAESTPASSELRSQLTAAGVPETIRARAATASRAELESLAMVLRATQGPLASPAGERQLVGRLASVLLPDAAAETLREASSHYGPDELELLVLPSPSCARVPWELLPTGNPDNPDERIIDIARVVTMTAVLGRDGDVRLSHPHWKSTRDLPPLHVIDPSAAGSVLVRDEGVDEVGLWRDRVRSTGLVSDARMTRDWLSQQLLDVQRSRFFYLGHVSATQATGGKTALVLNDSYRTYGLALRRGDRRDFTAQDALAGTVGRDIHFDQLAQRTRTDVPTAINEEFGGVPEYPTRSLDESGAPLSVPGRVLWPMPPRVAIVACQSGTDHSHAEPFGLVTAFLELGAELVTATRWTLLTDVAVRALYALEATPLHDLAVAIDDMHDTVDPLAALAVWQRSMLARWRDDPSIASSPLTWASATNYSAPDRTIRDGNTAHDAPR